jgi:hypothetical protein
MEDVFSLDEILEADDVKYATVKAYGGTARLGSLSSAAMVDWLDINEDSAKRPLMWIYLLAMSVVDAEGRHLPKDQIEAAVEKFRNKDSKSNRACIKKARELIASLKNASGEANTDASPSVSDSPRVN